MLTVGSLFSGIGGFDLGLERAGMRTLWFCEQDEFCRRVLARHWPGVPCYPDVRALVADTERSRLMGAAHVGRSNGAAVAERRPDWLGEDPQRLTGEGRWDGALPVPVPFWTPEDGQYTVVARPDVLCGGFPCQDISLAGRGAGLAGERSGLWREFARLIGELRPRYVLVENVPALTSRGLDVVLADLASCGFDAEWDHLPASAFGAPHRRDRIWLVAYPASEHGGQGRARRSASGGARESVAVGALQDADLADTAQPRLEGFGLRRRPAESGWWLTEPDVGRVAHGIPARVDRLRSLGNSLVPQIAEWIGRRIIEWEHANDR